MVTAYSVSGCFENLLFVWIFEHLSTKFKLHYSLTRITVLYMKTNTHFRPYLAQVFVELKIFQTKVVDKLVTHI